MPELPEVEQVRATLIPNVVGKIIKKVKVIRSDIIKHPSAEKFCNIIVGQTISDIDRKGKYLIINFMTNIKLVIHLRMTGALMALSNEEKEPKYASICFELTGDVNLWYTDIRRFGTMHLIVNDDIKIPGLENLGPEPFAKELTGEYLFEICKHRRIAIKGVILEQNIIAGLGNIYADEALAKACILPQRKAKTLTLRECRTLVEAINVVIKQGILNHGTTFRDYKDGNGNKGSNQYHLQVYGRSGEKCKNCSTILLKDKVAGRSTTYCPNCQK